MEYLYAEINPATEEVISERSLAVELTADQIKHVNGKPLLRPLTVIDSGPFDPTFQQLGEPVYDVAVDQVTKTTPVLDRDPAVARPAALVCVQTECKRRLATGFDYDFGDARGIHRIGTTERDMAGWDEVTMLAQALINAADTSTTIKIATDTGICDVTAPEWNTILLAAGAFRQPIWQASFVLQAMDPVPADYANDARWQAPA